MYNIVFYEENGVSDVYEFIRNLHDREDKNSRINFTKIYAYLDLLEQYGIKIGEPYVKHISGELWELRPLRNRLFFAAINENGFLILHLFSKKTQKTPKKEILTAERRLARWKERNETDENLG